MFQVPSLQYPSWQEEKLAFLQEMPGHRERDRTMAQL